MDAVRVAGALRPGELRLGEDSMQQGSATLRADEREFEGVLRRVERRERARSRVRVLGAVYTGLSLLGTLAAGLAFAAIAPWGLLSGDPTATIVLGSLGSIVAGTLLVLSLPGLVAGVGLLKRRPWARSLALVLAIPQLFWVPLGTLLGAFTLAVLIPDDTRELFEP